MTSGPIAHAFHVLVHVHVLRYVIVLNKAVGHFVHCILMAI